MTAWALGRSGMSAEVIACRIVASLMIQYSAYLAAVIVSGPGLWAGVFGDGGSLAITTVAAVLAAALAAAVLSLALMPEDIEQRLQRFAGRTRRFGGVLRRLTKAPEAPGSRVRTARDLVRERRLGLLGAVAYWGFDIAVLSVCFDAFWEGCAGGRGRGAGLPCDLILAPAAARDRRVSRAAPDGPRLASGRRQAAQLTLRRARPLDSVG